MSESPEKLIKYRMIDLGINGKDLARLTGISYYYLVHILSGRRKPGKHAASLAKALGLKREQLGKSGK